MSRAIRCAAVLAPLLVLAVCLAGPEPKSGEIDQLIEQLGDGRFRIREAATARLIRIGRPALPALRAALKSEDLEVQCRVRKILEAIQSSLEDLLESLKTGDAVARREAIAKLTQLGEKARPIVPDLLKLLDTKDEGLKEAITSALSAIDPENRALEKLIPAKAHCNGRYTKLLRKIHVPQDRQNYGDFNEYGHYQATDWQGHMNIPAGFWVYVYPHWYIWGEVKGGPDVVAPQIERPLPR